MIRRARADACCCTAFSVPPSFCRPGCGVGEKRRSTAPLPTHPTLLTKPCNNKRDNNNNNKRNNNQQQTTKKLLGFARYYALILEHSKPSLGRVLRVFAAPNGAALPALVHCAHGKDRTGVVVALLLAACGAPREAIVEDYVRVGVFAWAARWAALCALCGGGGISMPATHAYTQRHTTHTHKNDAQ